MTHRPWLATYRECGIPAQIDPNAHRSVVHMLEAAMKKRVLLSFDRSRENLFDELADLDLILEVKAKLKD